VWLENGHDGSDGPSRGCAVHIPAVLVPGSQCTRRPTPLAFRPARLSRHSLQVLKDRKTIRFAEFGEPAGDPPRVIGEHVAPELLKRRCHARILA